MPLKVNINNKELWLNPSTHWKDIEPDGLTESSILEIDANFYIIAERKDIR